MVILLLACANKKEADKISQALLRKHLIACAKSFPVSSDFWWKGKICSAREVLLIMETTALNFKATEKQVRQLHSYQMPGLLSFKVNLKSRGVADWLKQSLKLL